jgi:hypothetical protein
MQLHTPPFRFGAKQQFVPVHVVAKCAPPNSQEQVSPVLAHLQGRQMQ